MAVVVEEAVWYDCGDTHEPWGLGYSFISVVEFTDEYKFKSLGPRRNTLFLH